MQGFNTPGTLYKSGKLDCIEPFKLLVFKSGFSFDFPFANIL